ncbi:MAG TPA: hypothetical protein VF245_00870 [Solirubrobacterales bacterium]
MSPAALEPGCPGGALSSKTPGAESTEWECFDGIFGFTEVRELRSGVLDADAEHVFTSGHCHSFAEALRHLIGAELIYAFNLSAEGCEEPEAEGHVLVRVAGRYLDARGWVDEFLGAAEGSRAFESEWDRVTEIAPRGWLANSSGWLEPRVADALPFAAALLERLQIPIDARPEAARGGEEVCGCTGS